MFSSWQDDPTDGFVPAVVIEVDEALGANAQRERSHAAPTGPDDMSAGRVCELNRRRSQATARPMDDHRLASTSWPCTNAFTRLPSYTPMTTTSSIDSTPRPFSPYPVSS
jgi:hypothetical protein